MKFSKRRYSDPGSAKSGIFVSVTEMASCHRCEQQFAFDLRFGNRRSKVWQQAARKGTRAHKTYQLQSVLGGRARDQRCFIASYAFGPDAPETEYFRSFRDGVLKRTLGGRYFIKVYYSCSPVVVQALRLMPFLRPACRRSLLWLAEHMGYERDV